MAGNIPSLNNISNNDTKYSKELVDRYCSPEYLQETFGEDTGAQLAHIDKCSNILLDHVEGKTPFLDFSKQLAKLLRVVAAKFHIELPEHEVNRDFAAQYTARMLQQVKSAFTNVEYLQRYITDDLIPFMSEEAASFTLTVGPGDDVNQFFPHDPEFFRSVFESYRRNLIVVFEGAQEGTFSNGYATLFNQEGSIELKPYYVDILKPDLQTTFGSENITIRRLSHENFVEITVTYHDDKIVKLVLVKSDFYIQAYEPFLVPIVEVSKRNTILCGIRKPICTQIFFDQSNLYKNQFHHFIFTHGSYLPSKYLKNKMTSWRIRLPSQRARSGKNIFRNLNLKPNGSEAMGFENSRLCANKSICSQGETNKNTFWAEGGRRGRKRTRRTNAKRRRLTKRRKNY